jgi:hypothetical protein
MAKQIDHIERVKSAIILDVSRSHKVRLMDVVEGQGLCEIGILNPFCPIESFF